MRAGINQPVRLTAGAGEQHCLVVRPRHILKSKVADDGDAGLWTGDDDAWLCHALETRGGDAGFPSLIVITNTRLRLPAAFDSNCQTARLREGASARHARDSSPVLFAAPGKPTSFSLPSRYRGCGAPKGAPLFPCVSISCGDARAFRRATAASSGSRAALLAAVGLPEEPSDPSPCGGISPSIGQSQGLRTISELLAGGPSASGRGPGTARAREVRFPTPAGAAPCSTILTPHDSAPDKQDERRIIYLGFNVKRRTQPA